MSATEKKERFLASLRMTKIQGLFLRAPPVLRFPDHPHGFRVTIPTYAMAIEFSPMPSGINLDRSSVRAAIPVAFRGASGERSRKEIARSGRVKRTAKE